MTTRHLPVLLLTALIAFFSATALHAEVPAPRTVSTTGNGVISTKADMAEVTMQATSNQKSASAAKQEVDRRINDFLESLEAMKIPRDDIIASTLRISPEYEYNNRNRIFSGYAAYRDITVTLRELDRLDTLLETATASEISHIQQVALKSSKEEDLKEKAFEEAIADSRRKAEVLANAYDADLGSIHTITYRSQQPLFAAKAEGAAMRLAADSGGGGQYVHDEITFTDQIEVVFELIIPR